jgi:hypothetical protein
MLAFTAVRVWHEYTQTNEAQRENVFPLLWPVREAECGIPSPKLALVDYNHERLIALNFETMHWLQSSGGFRIAPGKTSVAECERELGRRLPATNGV